MPSNEAYPCYVRIGDSNSSEDLVELPTENDGTMLLSTITAQFEDAIGLRFKSESGAWRGVRVTDGVLDAPLEGWGDGEYFITLPKKAGKRKAEDEEGPADKKKMSEKEMLSDLICLGLPYSLEDEEFKTYFEKFGELDMYEIKCDSVSKKSRGFGFIRYKTVEAVEAVLAATHEVGGRKCEVRFPKKESQSNQNYGDDIQTKLFIGRLPKGTTVEDLREQFSEYGPLKDVYIPTNFRGFGFVTFASQGAARDVMNNSHVLKGNRLNISYPAPKAGEQQQQMVVQQQQPYGYGNMQGGYTQGGMQGGYTQGGMQGGYAQGGTQGGYMQGSTQGGYMQGGTQGGNMQGSRQGGNMQSGNMQGSGYGNNMNNGQYTSGYYQNTGKVQGGK